LGPWWFPRVAWVHFTQTFVALFGDAAFGFFAQPQHGVVEILHGDFLDAFAFTTADERAFAL
jgi:hypothetical protein